MPMYLFPPKQPPCTEEQYRNREMEAHVEALRTLSATSIADMRQGADQICSDTDTSPRAWEQSQGNCGDVFYSAMLGRVQGRFHKNFKDHGPQLFSVRLKQTLFKTYLESFESAVERSHHNCATCRDFLDKFGSLVFIDPKGYLVPAFWDPLDAYGKYILPFDRMYAALHSADVEAPFFAAPREPWGVAKTGCWTHYHVTPPTSILYTGKLLTPWQASAAKVQDFENVLRAISEVYGAVVRHAVELLESRTLQSSQKFIAPAKWLLGLYENDGHYASVRSTGRRNRLWRAVAAAPEGFCHPRSGMLGTLFHELNHNPSDIDGITQRWNSKVDPGLYQRPQAPPAAGNIQAAELAIAKLGLETALPRRIASLDEIRQNAPSMVLWTPRQPLRNKPDYYEPPRVFHHLAPFYVGHKTLLAPVTMTWQKFAAEMLIRAQRITLPVPAPRSAWSSFTASVNPDSQPLFKWPGEYGMYAYQGGSLSHNWNFKPGDTAVVNAFVTSPSSRSPGFRKSVLVVLDSCYDTRQPGLALFPEILRSELHPYRSTIEAHSRAKKMQMLQKDAAAGLLIGEGAIGLTFNVTGHNTSQLVTIDRWD